MKKLLTFLVVIVMANTTHAQNYPLGDINRDGNVNITDVIKLVDIILKGYEPLTFSSDNVVIMNGSTTTVDILSGYGPFTIAYDMSFLDVSLNGKRFTITGKEIGTDVLMVTDQSTGNRNNISVTVNAKPLALSYSSIELVASGSATVEITSGNGSYSIESSNASVATATINNGRVTITSVGGGIATITVTDTKSGQTATIEVTVEGSPMAYLTCPDDHHPHLIDLGLPSGTKWACCNVDATTPEGYGGYYAWGETEEKDIYDNTSYTYQDLGRNIAGTAYDVAHVKWGSSWVMPSKEQQEELNSNCTSEWTTQNGVNGELFKGPNGSTIFLPAAGIRIGSNLMSDGSSGNYWLSTLSVSNTNNAYNLFFSSISTGSNHNYRSSGLSVRPVVSYPALELSLSSLRLLFGENSTISVISGSGYYSAASNNTKVATVIVDGNSVKVTSVDVGTATITVTDTHSGQTATIEVTVSLCPDDHHPHMIDLGLPSGTKWACCNVGADKPEAYGGYYAWGMTEESENYSEGYYKLTMPHFPSDSDISGTEYDVAHVRWGGSWVMPSEEQCIELSENCTSIWTTQNGVKGKLLTGPSGSIIFFPAAGYRDGSNLNNAGRNGYMWVSNLDWLGIASYLGVSSNYIGVSYEEYRYTGRSVRAIVGQ